MEGRDPRPPRNPLFTGRDELLHLLRQHLRPGTPTVRPEVMYGTGRVGKTQLAIEYASRHQSPYDDMKWLPTR
ncbi:hypothetical protein QBA54_37435 [Streptomyces sp. B21-108]|jgi:hypothetical protein|uniref:hypothetical protein n=1 Tax=Streptomyces sp. B21-108 TaxID=3039419 RepID=UPI002FEF9717